MAVASAQFDLALQMTEGTTLHGELQYSCDLFCEATAKRLVGHFAVSHKHTPPPCCLCVCSFSHYV